MMFIQEGDNFNSFENDIKKDNKIIFDYLIKKGVCTVGNAIAIVKTLDFDQEILKEINDKIEVF